jgi:hypothetical protein
MRRLSSLICLCILAVSACSSSTGSGPPAASGSGAESSQGAAATPRAGGCEDYWCGTGSAQVTIGGQTYTFSPGGCIDDGVDSITFRMGDFEDTGAEAGDWFSGIVYRSAAAPTISGKIGSQAFVLTNATATVGLNGEVTFAGTDTVGGAKVTGTFNCG